jgi:hypothetical protein
MLLSFITALREARLHKGMVYGGRLWEALSTSAGIQGYVGGNRRPWKFNPFGVSSSLFLIELLGGLGLLALTCSIAGVGVWVALIALCAVSGAAIAYFGNQHRAGAALARDRLSRDTLAKGDPEALRNHISASTDDAHRDMLELLAMAGLVAFVGFQLLAGLGDVEIESVGALRFKEIEIASPVWLASYMIIVTGIALISYVRLRLAVGCFSIFLDPTDHPFHALSFDDAFFGLVILLVPISFDVFLLLSAVLPQWSGSARGLVTGAVALVIIIGERLLMVAIGRSLSPSASEQGSPDTSPRPS